MLFNFSKMRSPSSTLAIFNLTLLKLFQLKFKAFAYFASVIKQTGEQFLCLVFFVLQSWETESDRVRQKLLSLIGRIGREARFETTSGKAGESNFSNYKCLKQLYLHMGWLITCGVPQVLDVLWELAHLPTLPSSLIQQALEEHLTILSDAYAVKEAIKRSYIIKCIEDIKRVGFTFGLVLLSE